MNPASLLPGLPKQSRILILRLRSMGDVVLLTPALRLLKEWRGDLRVSVVIEPRFRELLEANPFVDELLDAPQGSGWHRAREQARLLRGLRARQFEVCLNLHGGPSSAFLAQFSGARWKAGFEHFRRRRIYDFAVPDARAILGQESVHTAEHQAAALFWLGVPRRAIPPAELFASEAAEWAWQEESARLGIAWGRDYVLLHPAALYSTKQWPPERFAKLGCYIEDELDLMAVYSCGPGESRCLDEVELAAGRPIRRIDAPSLGMLMAVISEARLFVGNDSGPAHVAAAFKTPCVVIFGSSNSKVWRPWTGSKPDFAFQIVQNPYECNPCPGDRCYRFARPECILSVTFEQTRAAADRVVQATQQEWVARPAANRLPQ